MKSVLILLAIVAFPMLYAQIPMLQQGNEWYYNVHCSSVLHCGYTHYVVGEDINIGGHTGQIVHKTMKYVNSPFAYQTQDILRQSNDTIFRYSEDAGIWHILYDFGAQPGDVWDIQTDTFVGFTYANLPISFIVQVDSLSTITIDGISRRVIYTTPYDSPSVYSDFSFAYHHGRIIEGIGPVDAAEGITGQLKHFLLGGVQWPSIACFMADGAFIWGNPETPCNALSTNETNADNAELNLYPNPVTDVFYITLPENAASLQLYSADGRLQKEIRLAEGKELQQFSISDLSAGFYLANVIDVRGLSLGQKRVVKF